MSKLVHTFILSDESVNNHGFKTITSGIDLSGFMANPVMLLNHDPDQCIGHWENIRVEGTQLKADAVFDEEDPEAVKIYKKVSKGDIKGCSVGLIPLKIEESLNSDESDSLIKSKLKEASVTPLPSNESAVKLYDIEGKVIPAELVKLKLSSINQPIAKPMNKLKLAMIALFSNLNFTIKLSDDADDKDFVEAVKNEIKLRDDKIVALSNSLKVVKDKQINDLITLSLEQGKIVKADEAKWRERAEKDLEMVADALNAIPAKTDINLSLERGASSPGAGNDKGGADEKKNWTLYDWSKNDEAGLKLMKKNDPDSYKKLLKAAKDEASEEEEDNN